MSCLMPGIWCGWEEKKCNNRFSRIMKEINPVKVSLGVRPKGGSRVPICGTVVYRCVVVFCRLLVCFAEDVAKPLACQGSSVDVELVTC